MAKIFCVANQKGGVGKTTTTVNLAASLAAQGQRVLLIDLDPQGNATMGSGIDKAACANTVYEVLVDGVVDSAMRACGRSGRLRRAAGEPRTGGRRSRTGRCGAPRASVEACASSAVEGEYDFVLIDCPPALSLLTLNGLCAAHGVVIPMQCEYFALEGLSDLVNTIKQVHANLNRDLKVIGLLRVMFDPRITLQQQVSEQLKEHFGDKVFDVVIPAQRASRRGAQLWIAGRRVRPGIARRAGVCAVRRGND